MIVNFEMTYNQNQTPSPKKCSFGVGMKIISLVPIKGKNWRGTIQTEYLFCFDHTR